MADPHLKAVIDQMIADGASHEQISDFVTKAAQSQQATSDRMNADRAARMDAAQQQYEQETSPSAIAGGIAETVGEKLVRLAKGAAKLGDIVSPVGGIVRRAVMGTPMSENIRETVAPIVQPEARRELERGVSDTMLGVPQFLADRLTAKLPDRLQRGTTGQEPTSLAATEQTDATAAPDYRMAGQIAGSFLPGSPAGGIAKGSMAVVGKATANPLLRAVAASQLASAATAGLNVNAGGIDDRLRAALDAGDPMNLIAAVPEAIAAGGRGMSSVLRKNKTIDTLARNRAAGTYDRPDMQALPSGEEGMQRASEEGLRRIIQRDQQLGQAAGNAYQSAVKPHLQAPVDPNTIRESLVAGYDSNIAPDSGLPLRPEVQAAYNRAFEATPDAPTVEGTLLRRRALKQEAGFGSPSPTSAQEATRDVYQTYRQGVRKASPEVAAADDAYTQYARQAQRRRDLLFNTEGDVIPSNSGPGAPDARPIDFSDTIGEIPQGAAEDLAGAPQLRVSKERAAATMLGRVGDTNVPGLRAKRYIDELIAQDPEFAKAVEFIAAKKALEGTRFGVGGHLPTSLHEATSMAGLKPILSQNARAIGALLEHGASAAGAGGRGGTQAALRINPLVIARWAQQERERQMAENLKGAGR